MKDNETSCSAEAAHRVSNDKVRFESFGRP